MKKNQESRIENLEFIFFALAPTGSGVSGSDRIFIEFARYWSEKFPVTIFTTQEGIEMMERQGLISSKSQILNPKQFLISKFQIQNLKQPQNSKLKTQNDKNLQIIKVEKSLPKNFSLKYIYKIFLGIKLGFTLKLTTNYQLLNTYLYSSSEFWMDSIPCFILKLRYPKVKWIAAWYQTAPKPWTGFSEGERKVRYNLRAFLYWFVQQPIKPLISKFADFVFVNNVEEKKQFPRHVKSGRAIVVLGAVPLDEIKKFRISKLGFRVSKEYDAVFQGRFHPQKGVIELIDIWRRVVDKKPDAKLAMIGDGPLFKDVESRIKNLGLGENVKLFGYVFDGPKKYSIFSRSKIVVHPAFYDSGGMAAAEAMAFGLPCVGFNLASYKSYYPKGMVKVKLGDLDSFAEKILSFLQDEKYRLRVGKEAKEMIEKNWDWKVRAYEVLKKI